MFARPDELDADRVYELAWSGAGFEDSDNAQAVLLPSGTFLRVNHAFSRLVGRCPRELLGISWRELIHPCDRRSVAASFAGAFASALRPTMFVARLHRPGGEPERVRFRILLVRDAANRPDAVLMEGIPA
jgi:PAS domain S-box-containing protein